MKFILNESNAKYILNEEDMTGFTDSSATTAMETDASTKATSTATTTSTGTGGAVDWMQEYKKCKTNADLKKFWTKYYDQEWGKDADTIKNLGKAFDLEIKEFGFSPVLNPFIAFLKHDTTYPTGKKIVDIITPQVYSIIHNIFVDNKLDKADLKGEGKFKKENIIFNVSLYAITDLKDVKTYLELQDRIERSNNIPNDKFTSYEEALKAIMYATPDEYSKDTITPAHTELQPATTVAERVELIAPQNRSNTITDTEIDKMCAAISIEEAKKYFRHVLTFFLLKYPNIGKRLESMTTEKYNNAFKVANFLETDTAKTVTLTANDISNLNRTLALNKEYAEAQAAELIIKLGEKAGHISTGA